MRPSLQRQLGAASTPLLCALLLCASSGCDTGVPDYDDTQPNYRSVEEGEPSSGERGNLQISEIAWAGSVTDDGVYDPDDVFIELWNKHPRPINVSEWRLIIEGDVVRTHRLPTVKEPIPPNGFYVIAAKADGAFGEAADMILPELRMGKKYIHIELRDADRRLIEGAGSDSEEIFTGGWDTYSTRSMERVQLIFGNQGGQSRNWHAYSDHVGFETVKEGYKLRTFASPGEANSADYSGSSTSGGVD